ncbi:MAG: hypothetical protein AB1611_08000 [bacterium]
MDKLKFLVFLGSLLWVCLLCGLRSIGSVGCVHRQRTGAGRFFELTGRLITAQKPKIITAVINRNTNPIRSPEEYHLFITFNFLSKYINPDKYQETLLSPCVQLSNILINHQEDISPSRENRLPFQILQIISTSIIRS